MNKCYEIFGLVSQKMHYINIRYVINLMNQIALK